MEENQELETPKKRCKECGDDRPVTNFRLTGGRQKRIGVCSPCLEKRYKTADPERMKGRARRRAASKRARRPEWAVLRDSKTSDSKKKREGNNLDLDFIIRVLSEGCCYCGEKEIKLTLDRRDNTLAHTKENVNPACIRCNMLRGSMPYNAWMHIVPAVREAKDLGLFGSWRSQPINRKNPPPTESVAIEDSTRAPRCERWSKTKSLPPHEEVKRMVNETSLRAVAKKLNCSHVAVWKYLKQNDPNYAGDSR